MGEGAGRGEEVGREWRTSGHPLTSVAYARRVWSGLCSLPPSLKNSCPAASVLASSRLSKLGGGAAPAAADQRPDSKSSRVIREMIGCSAPST